MNDYTTPAKERGMSRTTAWTTDWMGDKEIEVVVDYAMSEDGEVCLEAVWYGGLDLGPLLQKSYLQEIEGQVRHIEDQHSRDSRQWVRQLAAA